MGRGVNLLKKANFSSFWLKSVLYVLTYISKSKIALEKRISDLESRQNYLSGSCKRFFHQTSSSVSKIHLKSGHFPFWPGYWGMAVGLRSEGYYLISHLIGTNEVSLDVKFYWEGFSFEFKAIRPLFRAELPGNRAVVEKKGRNYVIFGRFSVKLRVLRLWNQL